MQNAAAREGTFAQAPGLEIAGERVGLPAPAWSEADPNLSSFSACPHSRVRLEVAKAELADNEASVRKE